MPQSTQLAHWVIDATQAKQLIATGATVLDTRNRVSWCWGHAPGAVRVNWKDFSPPQVRDRGKLLDDINLLEQKLRALGVSNDRPVVVVGYPNHPCSFGEDGRIVWMLRTLGHPAAALVDGGQAALEVAGVPRAMGSTPPRSGNFTSDRTRQWEISKNELKHQLAHWQLIDTREFREYAGATPYGERRGGHLPGAVHFYFKHLLDEQGKLLPRQEILARLHQTGIEPNRPIVAYCTGGVRSAFFVAVLAELGISTVKNYPGSTWEWSASAPDSYPLEKLKD